jgi:hypothetical protein
MSLLNSLASIDAFKLFGFFVEPPRPATCFRGGLGMRDNPECAGTAVIGDSYGEVAEG